MRVRLKYIVYNMNPSEGTTYHVVQDDELINWDEIKHTIKRKDYTGVTRGFTDKLEFCGEMYDILLDFYLRLSKKYKATIIIEALNDNWTYNELYSFVIDFTSVEFDGWKATVNSIDGDFATELKNAKSTKFDLNCSEETYPLLYDGVTTYPSCDVKHDFGQTLTRLGSVKRYKSARSFTSMISLPLEIEGTGVTCVKSLLTETDAVGIDSNLSGRISVDGYSPFFNATADCKLRLVGKFYIQYENPMYGNYYQPSRVVLLRVSSIIGNYDQVQVDAVEDMPDMKLTLFDGTFKTFEFDCDVELVRGESLVFAILTSAYNTSGGFGRDGDTASFNAYLNSNDKYNHTIPFTFNVMQGSPDSMFNAIIDCKVVTPKTLLTALVNKIYSGATASIDDTNFPVLKNTFFVTAQELRGKGEGVYKASYGDFCKWMEAVFGFVPHVNETSKHVTFKHRDTFFKDIVVQELYIQSSESRLTYNSDIDYYNIEVGYEKEDYEKEFGADEWRWKMCYVTMRGTGGRTLSLVSPFRCDCYGMEYLVASRRTSESSSDDKNDDKLFFVCAQKESDGKLHLVREDYSVKNVTANADKLFNVMYSPYFMLQNNARFISSINKNLKFASAEGNTKVQIVHNGKTIFLNNSIALDAAPLFYSAKLEVETDIFEDVKDWTGLVKAKFGDYTMTAYVEEVESKICREDKTTYKLLVKSVE